LINGWDQQDEHYRYVRSGIPDLYEAMSGHWAAWQIGKQHFFSRDKIDQDPKVKVNWITKKDYEQWVKSKGVKKPGGRKFTALVPELVSGKYTSVHRYTVPEYAVYKPGLRYFPDDYFGDQCVSTIRNHKDNKPLLLIATFMSPHPPFDIPEPYFDKVKESDLAIPDNVGKWYPYQSPLQLYALTGFIGTRYSREDWSKIWTKYYGLVSLLDHEVGRIIDALKNKGLYHKALIIFTADHGEMLGSHSLWMKNCMYEASAHVPLIVKFPEGFHPAVKQTDQLVSLIDVWPTLIDYLGINTKDHTDGISLMPLVNGKILNRNKIFIQYDGNAGYGSNQRCVVDGDYKLIMDTFKNEIYLELYNVVKDPEETTNLAVDPHYEAQTRKLINEIKSYMTRTNDLLKFPDHIYSGFIAHHTK
jgi:choline-sulfatase